jgi:hypothetical protein
MKRRPFIPPEERKAVQHREADVDLTSSLGRFVHACRWAGGFIFSDKKSLNVSPGHGW